MRAQLQTYLDTFKHYHVSFSVYFGHVVMIILLLCACYLANGWTGLLGGIPLSVVQLVLIRLSRDAAYATGWLSRDNMSHMIRRSFETKWSQEDQCYIGVCDQHPLLSYCASTAKDAEDGIVQLVNEVDSDIELTRVSKMRAALRESLDASEKT